MSTCRVIESNVAKSEQNLAASAKVSIHTIHNTQHNTQHTHNTTPNHNTHTHAHTHTKKKRENTKK